MTIKSFLLLCLFSTLCFVHSSCTRTAKVSGNYAFFVAGHAYGAPRSDNPGLHPPFLDKFDIINKDTVIKFGILTGDIVRTSSIESWDSVDAQLRKLHIPVYFCPGNHDMYDRILYESRYGNPYYSFKDYDDLFVVLDGNINRWNISGKQLEFLTHLLSHKNKAHNVFIFVHQLVWWKKQSVFEQVNLNWPPYTPDSTNYWSTIEPILKDFKGNVFLFAGDLGANHQSSSLMYYRDGNITYIGSGMGDNKRDHFIKVIVNQDKEVKFEIIALQGDPNKFGKLESYSLK